MHYSHLVALATVSCTALHAQTPQAGEPALPRLGACISSQRADFRLPLPDSVAPSARLSWAISWNERAVAQHHSGDYGLVIQDTLPEGPRPLGERLRNLAFHSYRLEPAGSITAIVSPQEPTMTAQVREGLLYVTLGPSTPLNELLAWRPDSLRVDSSFVMVGRPVPLAWLRAAYP
jgi:hypothetical protein